MPPIEVVCVDMMCFKVDAETLVPLSCSYYQPAAWNDPRGSQMSYSQWLQRCYGEKKGFLLETPDIV